MVMAKIVNAALKAKAWTFEAKAIGPEAKTIKIGLEAKAWPRGLHHWKIPIGHLYFTRRQAQFNVEIQGI